SASNGTPGYTYLWTPSTGLDDATAANPIASPHTTTKYVLHVTDLHHCMDADSMMVNVQEPPVADAGPDQMICLATPVALGGQNPGSGGTPPYTFAWTPSTGLSSTTVAHPMASPASNTTYILTVTDSKGCVDADSVDVKIRPQEMRMTLLGIQDVAQT